jgi:maleate cis-trans isomerase
MPFIHLPAGYESFQRRLGPGNPSPRLVGKQADCPEAEPVFLSGTGMPTLPIIQTLEDDLGKPVLSAASAMMWAALRAARVSAHRPGYGRLFAQTPPREINVS